MSLEVASMIKDKPFIAAKIFHYRENKVAPRLNVWEMFFVQ